MVTWGSPIGRTPLYPTMTFLIIFRWMVQPPDAGCLPHPRKLPGPSARDVYRNLICSESEHWGGSRERNKKKSMCSYHQIWIHMELPAIFPSNSGISSSPFGSGSTVLPRSEERPHLPRAPGKVVAGKCMPSLLRFASDIFLWQSCEPSQES
jgi:hypothetical protein